MKQALDELKSSIRIYLAVASGHTPELSMLLAKTPDIFDSMLSDEFTTAAGEMRNLAYIIVRRLAGHYLQRLSLYYQQNRDDRVRDAATALRVVLDLLDSSTDLDRSQARKMTIRALSSAVAVFSTITKTDYPDLEKL